MANSSSSSSVSLGKATVGSDNESPISFGYSVVSLSPSSLSSSLTNSFLKSEPSKQPAESEEVVRAFMRSGKVYPPPITCLRQFKKGKPYYYLRVNEDDGSDVVEDIRIPQFDLLRASRENGRLRLYVVHEKEEDWEVVDGDKEAEDQKVEEESLNVDVTNISGSALSTGLDLKDYVCVANPNSDSNPEEQEQENPIVKGVAVAENDGIVNEDYFT